MATTTEIVGQYLSNPQAIVDGAARAGLDLSIACAFADMESDGNHIYGNDLGGVFGRVNSTDPYVFDNFVTEQNFAEFLTRVRAGERSNGVGIMQITWPPFFDQAEDEGIKLWVPEENVYFGSRFIRTQLALHNGNLADAATVYRHGTVSADRGYATKLLESKAQWDTRLNGAGDSTTTVRTKKGRGKKSR